MVFTPAHAGKTIVEAPGGLPPLTRGKHRMLISYPCGLPPRARGKRLLFHLHHLLLSAYPRACGENLRYNFPDQLASPGLPPRLRGELAVQFS